MAFKKGEIVMLKSGGPPMTVDALPGEEKLAKVKIEYLCRWFKGASPERGSFAEHILETYVPPAAK